MQEIQAEIAAIRSQIDVLRRETRLSHCECCTPRK